MGFLVDGRTQYLRVDTAKEIERVSSRFNVVDTTSNNEIKTDTNLEIRYKVVKGNGTLYAAVSETETAYVGPNQDLTVHHQDSKVFLNTNGTDNEVSASIAGQDLRKHLVRRLCMSIVEAQRRPTVPTVRQPSTPSRHRRQPSQPAPPALTVSTTSISGAPSSAQTLTITTTAPLAQISVNPSTAFRTAGGFASPAIATTTANTYTSTITLPAVAGTYTATVNAGTAGRQITITVAADQDHKHRRSRLAYNPVVGRPVQQPRLRLPQPMRVGIRQRVSWSR